MRLLIRQLADFDVFRYVSQDRKPRSNDLLEDSRSVSQTSSPGLFPNAVVPLATLSHAGTFPFLCEPCDCYQSVPMASSSLTCKTLW